ncbi:hypothetical protein NLJ89_g3944 [Agrocybe chaxingu]|uniref:F-box domain-containing protein n=1 Tax=Agrocybe chaxingu TaxID=84603 RepID=A0A9W8K3T3_9AGAR|nr:hypothetical protein NLJ89_g3944 [Agrocybe chaxingu]
MGGSDFFCSITGAHYLWRVEKVAEDILEVAQNAEDSEGSADELDDEENDQQEGDSPAVKRQKKLESLSAKLRNGLHYTQEDVESSCEFVIICPYDFHPCLIGQPISSYPDPEHPSVDNITHVFNIVPGMNPELGDYVSNPDDGNRYSVLGYGNCLIIARTAFYILQAAAPAVRPWMIYALAYSQDRGTQGHIKGVDYGPVSYTLEQYSWTAAICGSQDSDVVKHFWRNLLIQDKSDEEILHEAWKGPGNMWVFKHPSRFPVEETMTIKPFPAFSSIESTNPFGKPTLDNLPVDILLSTCEHLPIRSICALMTTCKRFRANILPHANAISYRRLLHDEPWYLPAGPFDTPRGRDEVDWWETHWSQALAVPKTDIHEKIPWLLYRRACSDSMSMWNRKRVWDISRQIEELCRKEGYLSSR